ncbi:MAG: 1-acyl-sn-glycerol-3-phosphate acyltransferase [Thermodesulfobacteriota bacterium]
MRKTLIYALLLGIKTFSRIFYRFDISWAGSLPKDPWADLRLILILNHTSLYEPLFVGWVPNRFLKHVAGNGLVPIADKTYNRPLVGRFFRMVAQNVISISRLRDISWDRFIDRIRPDSLVIMLPEGRMKRQNGLDANGNPMTIRGGVADLLEAIPSGRMLIAYSGGLHHVQIPSQLIPRLFKTLRMRVESLDVSHYKHMLWHSRGSKSFKQAVVTDLENRLRINCPDGYC